jgi:hypothetical protein
MRPVEIGLVDTTGTVDIKIMAATVAALNVQITQHLPQFWPTVPAAVVRLLTEPNPIPQGVWPLRLVNKLKYNEGGFHYTDHNQPGAKVVVTPNSNDWTIDASHEVLEMLVDPGGNRLQMGKAIKLAGTDISDAEGDVEYLLEISDPCEGPRYAYEIHGVAVSDFITPDFYEDRPLPNARYSFTGSIKAPRQVLHGGYITWVRPKSSMIEQLLWLATDTNPKIRKIGKASDSSLREFVDSETRHAVHVARAKYKTSTHRGGKSMATKFQIKAGEKTPRHRHESAYTVKFHQDGEIEREIWDHGAQHPRVETQKVKANTAYKRAAGTEHTVRNKGGSLLTGEKEI